MLIAFTGVGVVLCWLRRRTGSLLPGVGLHGSWNALAAGLTGAGWWVSGGLGLLAASMVLAVSAGSGAVSACLSRSPARR